MSSAYRASDPIIVKVAVAAQPPPPMGGQAAMVQALLDMRSPDVTTIPVPFRFSSDMSDMGRVRAGKLGALLRALTGTAVARARGADTLYYCVAGAERLPL